MGNKKDVEYIFFERGGRLFDNDPNIEYDPKYTREENLMWSHGIEDIDREELRRMSEDEMEFAYGMIIDPDTLDEIVPVDEIENEVIANLQFLSIYPASIF